MGLLHGLCSLVALYCHAAVPPVGLKGDTSNQFILGPLLVRAPAPLTSVALTQAWPPQVRPLLVDFAAPSPAPAMLSTRLAHVFYASLKLQQAWLC